MVKMLVHVFGMVQVWGRIIKVWLKRKKYIKRNKDISVLGESRPMSPQPIRE